MDGNSGKITTICYGKEREWESREEAEDYFLEAVSQTDGSEQRRYMNIYTKLKHGELVCSDTDE